MTSESASITSRMHEPDRDEPQEAAKIPLKHKGLDIAEQMRSVKQAEPDLARAVGNYSASVELTLGVIQAIEDTLQHKRRQIDEIQARQAVLAREYKELGETLELATKDLARQFTGIIRGLEADLPIPTPPAEGARGISETGAGLPPKGVPETSETAAKELPAESASDQASDSALEIDETSGLDLDTSDLPPVPEFLGGRPKLLDQMDDKASEDAGSGSRGWWRQGKK
jgi:hypothetical protein